MDPDIGLEPAISALGWACERTAAGDAAEAIGCLREALKLGLGRAAEITDEQARLLGGMQYDLAVGNDPGVVAALRALAPTYAHLGGALRV